MGVPHMYPTWGTWGTFFHFGVQKKKNFGPFCYKNVEKMFYQPQKVTLSPQKVKKVKKVKKNLFFIFHILCEKKSHLYIYFLNLGPLPHLKNPYYENIKFFQKIKFSSNLAKNL